MINPITVKSEIEVSKVLIENGFNVTKGCYPDFIVTKDKRFCFVEAKSPYDSLSMTQCRTVEVLHSIGIPTCVVRTNDNDLIEEVVENMSPISDVNSPRFINSYKVQYEYEVTQRLIANMKIKQELKDLTKEKAELEKSIRIIEFEKERKIASYQEKLAELRDDYKEWDRRVREKVDLYYSIKSGEKQNE